MKTKFFFISLFLCLGIATLSSGLSGCGASANIGPVGADASVGE